MQRQQGKYRGSQKGRNMQAAAAKTEGSVEKQGRNMQDAAAKIEGSVEKPGDSSSPVIYFHED